MKVLLYSDGSSRGNPGPGGFGTILRYTNQEGKTFEREFSQGYINTTNNRMELLGVITGLEALNRPCTVEVHTDSQYVVNAFKNIDLWKRLIAAKEPHSVSFHWVKGHAGHPLNERCDDLATTAADGMGKIIDEGFES